jgi:hypothetical protein
MPSAPSTLASSIAEIHTQSAAESFHMMANSQGILQRYYAHGLPWPMATAAEGRRAMILTLTEWKCCKGYHLSLSLEARTEERSTRHMDTRKPI